MSGAEIFLLCLGIIVFLGICFYLYGYFFEVRKTRILRFYYHDKTLAKVKEPIEGAIKIVFFSDLHLGKMLKGKQLQNKLDKLLKCQGDIYLFGGDLIGYDTAKYFTPKMVSELFQPFLNKPCFKVTGNHEYKKESHITQQQKDAIFQAFPFQYLENETIEIKVLDKTLSISGLKEGQYHTPKLQTPLKGDIKIVLVHQGDYFDTLDEGDIVLAGHTHGGQIKIPLCPLFYHPKHGKKYIQGLYQKNNRYLIVSKGIGCNMFKFRFSAPSDIIEIYIKD